MAIDFALKAKLASNFFELEEPEEDRSRFAPYCLIEIERDPSSLLDTYCVAVRHPDESSAHCGVPSLDDVCSFILRELQGRENEERQERIRGRMQNNKNNKQEPFPPEIIIARLGDASWALSKARLFYQQNPNCPRTCAEARDRFEVMEGASEIQALGDDNPPWTDTTCNVAAHLGHATVHEDNGDDGFGESLCVDVSGDNGTGRLMLIQWNKMAARHYVADVSGSIRIESVESHNDEVALRAKFKYECSPGTHYERFVGQAGDALPGDRIIFDGLTREIVDTEQRLWEATGLHDLKIIDITFGSGQKLSLPACLEITFVNPGNV